MKEVKRKLNHNITEVQVESLVSPCLSSCLPGGNKYTFTITTSEYINPENIEIYGIFYEPENIKEFRKQKSLSKEELFNWITENYD